MSSLSFNSFALTQCFPTVFQPRTLTWNRSPAGTPLHFWHKFLNDLFSHLHKKFHLSNQISNLKRKTYKVCKKHLNFSKTEGIFKSRREIIIFVKQREMY